MWALEFLQGDFSPSLELIQDPIELNGGAAGTYQYKFHDVKFEHMQ